MCKQIRPTEKPLSTIKDTGQTLTRLDSRSLARGLGAEPTDENSVAVVSCTQLPSATCAVSFVKAAGSTPSTV